MGTVHSIQNDSSIHSKPMERAIEARGADDAMSSMVRCVFFSKTHIVSRKFHVFNLSKFKVILMYAVLYCGS